MLTHCHYTGMQVIMVSIPHFKDFTTKDAQVRNKQSREVHNTHTYSTTDLL